MKIGLKIMFSILATFTLAVGGLFTLLVVAIGGAAIFYQVLTAVCFFIAWLYLILLIWFRQKVKAKTLHIIAGATVGALIIPIAVFQINSAYHESLKVVSEQDFNLSLYDPFRKDTLTVALDEPSTLRLTDDLPYLDGATALYPVYAAFVRAVYPEDYDGDSGEDVEVDENGIVIPRKAGQIVDCAGTARAYDQLIKGEVDIIFAAGPSESQLADAKERNVELKLTPIGREAFVFFVNAENPVNGLSSNNIKRIYSGGALNWSDFGGSNSAIKAFQRPEDSGSQTALINFMGDVPLMTPPKEDISSGMGGIISRVSEYRNYENAIGFSFLFFASEMVRENKIKLLEIDGVAPTKESVANRTYPLAAEFYAVTAGTSNPNTERFIEWILSDQGQSLIGKTGYTPVLVDSAN